MSLERLDLLFNKGKNYFPCIHPYDVTFKEPKHVARIYKCYLKVGINRLYPIVKF
jgi:hypothetical protein